MTVVYVVTVEQFYANTFSLQGAFLTLGEAEACRERLGYGGADVHIYACDGDDCEDVDAPLPRGRADPPGPLRPGFMTGG